MKKPSTVVLDATACIIHSLKLELGYARCIQHSDCKYVRSVVDSCDRESVEVGTFRTAKNECNNRITEAAVRLVRSIGALTDSYVALKVRRIAMDHLGELFSRLVEFEERTTPEEIKEAREFFIRCEIPSRSHFKDNIPGENDLTLFVSSHNLRQDITHFVSEDGHFVDYAQKIDNSDYRVRIMPVRDLPQILKELNWPIDSGPTNP